MSMLFFKLADAVVTRASYDRNEGNAEKRERREQCMNKYKKDISDFAAMFNGIIAHYEGVDFSEVANHIYHTCDSAFKKNINRDSISQLKQFYMDVLGYIDEDKRETLLQLVEAIIKKNQEKISESHS